MRPKLLGAVLLVGLAVRLAILWNIGDLGLKTVDEQQFGQLAASVLHGEGLAWEPGRPTSLRPPLYPAFVAAIWTVAGEGSLQAVRLAQIFVALLTALLTYELGRRVFTPTVGAVAASITWLYPSLVFLNFTILTETLFTFFLVAFVLLAVILLRQPRGWIAALCGLALGLGALTRSVLWPTPLLLCPLLVWLLDGTVRRRVALSALVLAGYATVVAPWAVRNTRLQGVVTIVDTIGGFNLRMGNYEHTPEDRMWDAVAVKGEQSWVYALTQEPGGTGVPAEAFTEGRKEAWARRKAVEYMLANPGTTIRRAAIKFSDFWGLERSFIAGVQQGLYRPPTWFAALAAGLIVLTCSGVLLLGATGLWLARPDWRMHILLLLPILVITGVHSIVFGHPRYHVPLVPVLAVFAAARIQTGWAIGVPIRRPAVFGALITVLLLLTMWGRQIFLVDSERLQALVRGLW